MKKIFLFIVLNLILFSFIADPPIYVTVVYNVSTPAGTYPSSLYATGAITYDSYNNPVHTIIPTLAKYDATKGQATWKFPKNSYVQFICQATGLSGTYKIVDDDGDLQVVLNDLIPALLPPEPSWTANYVPYTGATGDVNLGGYNLEANSLFISGNSIWGKIHDGAGPIFVLSNYGGTLVSGNFLELNIDRSKVLFVDMYGGVHLQPVRGEVPLQIQSSGEIITFRSEVSEDTNTLSFECPLDKSVTTTVPSTGGIIWTNNNLGYANYETDGILTSTDWNTFNKKEDALTKGDLSESTSSVLTITNGTGAVIGEGTTIQVKQASALQDGYLSKEDFATFNSKDGVVGNEVTDTADTTLTRTGGGTAEDPYKLKLNLANANAFTANQTAPYFLSSSEYNADNPRPLGFPQTSANNLDEEFNGSFAHSFQVYDSGSATTNFDKAGYLTITSVTFGKYYYMTDLGSNKLTGDFDVTIHFAQPPYASHIGLALATDESTPKTYVMSLYWGGSSSSFYCSGRNNGWVAGSTAQVYYIYGIQYFRFIRYNGNITAYFSTDGIGWTQSQIRNVETSSTVSSISESNAIKYYGIYVTVYSGTGLNCPSHILANAVDWIRFE